MLDISSITTTVLSGAGTPPGGTTKTFEFEMKFFSSSDIAFLAFLHLIHIKTITRTRTTNNTHDNAIETISMVVKPSKNIFNSYFLLVLGFLSVKRA